MLRSSPFAVGRLFVLLAALPLLGVSPAPTRPIETETVSPGTAAQAQVLASPGECARARDLEIRTEPLSGEARGAVLSDAGESVSGAAFRHFRAADVAAPLGVATASAADWAVLSDLGPRSFGGPGSCDSAGSGCTGAVVQAPQVRSTARAPATTRRASRGRGKGRAGRKCD